MTRGLQAYPDRDHPDELGDYYDPGPTIGLGAYDALRMSLEAGVPDGMKILVTLSESDGESHFHEPPPSPAGTRQTITIRLSQFKHASWTRKADMKLDAGDVCNITFGMHGTPKGDKDSGRLLVANVAFVPRSE